MECNGCRFCCWSYSVEDVPQQAKGPGLRILQYKAPLSHCQHECEAGCSIHEQKGYPKECRDFRCPYLVGDSIHRPDTFQSLLVGLGGNLGGYVPTIPYVIPVLAASKLITETRTVLASRIFDYQWKKIVMPLDTETDGNWYPKEEFLPPWDELCTKYGVTFAQKGRENNIVDAHVAWGSQVSGKISGWSLAK